MPRWDYLETVNLSVKELMAGFSASLLEVLPLCASRGLPASSTLYCMALRSTISYGTFRGLAVRTITV